MPPRPRVTRSSPGERPGPRAPRSRIPTGSRARTTGAARRRGGRTSRPRHVVFGHGPTRQRTHAHGCGRPAGVNASPASSTASPSASSASSSSPLTCATPARPPRGPACASPMLVITPTVGRAIAHRAAMSPWARAPISSTSASVAAGAPRSVSGRPGLVVVRTGAGVHVELGRQRGGGEVLGAGLARRAGDADHGRVLPAGRGRARARPARRARRRPHDGTRPGWFGDVTGSRARPSRRGRTRRRRSRGRRARRRARRSTHPSSVRESMANDVARTSGSPVTMVPR